MKIRELDHIPEDGEVSVEKISITYQAPPDCCANADMDFQSLTLETINNGVDSFIRMSITGDVPYFSVNDVTDLVEIFEDFSVRSGVNYGLQKEKKK